MAVVWSGLERICESMHRLGGPRRIEMLVRRIHALQWRKLRSKSYQDLWSIWDRPRTAVSCLHTVGSRGKESYNTHCNIIRRPC